jgi:hypothetical protein
MTKLTDMARLVVEGEPGLTAAAKLLGLVTLMASCLGAEARLAVAEQMRQEADALMPPSDRRSLHWVVRSRALNLSRAAIPAAARVYFGSLARSLSSHALTSHMVKSNQFR